MARKSLIVKEYHKQALVERYKKRRDYLRNEMKRPDISPNERMKAQFKLQKLPALSSPTRLRLRCSVTGRARGVIRKYGLARTELRRMASNGQIPGMRKSSW